MNTASQWGRQTKHCACRIGLGVVNQRGAFHTLTGAGSGAFGGAALRGWGTGAGGGVGAAGVSGIEKLKDGISFETFGAGAGLTGAGAGAAGAGVSTTGGGVTGAALVTGAVLYLLSMALSSSASSASAGGAALRPKDVAMAAAMRAPVSSLGSLASTACSVDVDAAYYTWLY